MSGISAAQIARSAATVSRYNPGASAEAVVLIRSVVADARPFSPHDRSVKWGALARLEPVLTEVRRIIPMEAPHYSMLHESISLLGRIGTDLAPAPGALPADEAIAALSATRSTPALEQTAARRYDTAYSVV